MAIILPPYPRKRYPNRTSIEVDIAILYAVKQGEDITRITYLACTSYQLLIRRLARFEEHGFLFKLGRHYTLTVKGEEVLRQWIRLRHLLGFTYLTGHAREGTPF